MSDTATPTPTTKKLLLSMTDLVALTGADRKTIGRWVEAGQLPRPLPLGRKKQWWSAAEVAEALLGQQTKGSDGQGVQDPGGGRRGE
jgi:predicted DNA-binding transcriptional regulator AlpA